MSAPNGFHKWRWRFVALWIVVFSLVGAWQLQTNHDQAANTNSALCALRADVQTRHDAGVQFLVDHPNGIPGISARQIQQSLASQASTLTALQDLNCD